MGALLVRRTRSAHSSRLSRPSFVRAPRSAFTARSAFGLFELLLVVPAGGAHGEKHFELPVPPGRWFCAPTATTSPTSPRWRPLMTLTLESMSIILPPQGTAEWRRAAPGREVVTPRRPCSYCPPTFFLLLSPEQVGQSRKPSGMLSTTFNDDP